MKIGYDAKRLYQNGTGLGHYSRTLVHALATLFTYNVYCLFAPKNTTKFESKKYKNIIPFFPATTINKIFKAFWRSSWVVSDLVKNNIELYHGLSHELPIGIHKTTIKTVVTMHDLIVERYPKQFSIIDGYLYKKKYRYACKHANKIIAISQQTKQDVINFCAVDANKIEVCYQSCNSIFRNAVSIENKNAIKQLYNLPDEYFLSVGSIIERKNLFSVVKALHQLKSTLKIPIVVIGNGGSYKKKIQQYIQQHNLQATIIFLSDTVVAKNESGFANSAHFPAIYQQAIALVYPSIYEGFGIPVLEALCSGLPVITSNTSCLPEAGGNAAYYVNPNSVQEIATALQEVYHNKNLQQTMIAKGYEHAKKFTDEVTATAVMNVYKNL